jgi:hypothetical protein
MPRAIDLVCQGRNEELWQMCCGYLKLDISEFMEIQRSLLLEQLELLKNSPLGEKIMHGARPKTIEEFRQDIPLTDYDDYYEDLSEKREDILPVRPALWARTSGKTGNYPCKWVPLTQKYVDKLSTILYGVGLLSCSEKWGDISNIPDKIKLLYAVAPKPYISGTFADILKNQTPLEYMPTIKESESLDFEERLKLGFCQAMTQGLDYFFGLSLVLAMIGDKFIRSSQNLNIRPFISSPRALWRIARGKMRSRIARRPLLPKDIWKLKGIIGSGVDSWIYKDKIKELWGKYPLDLYSCTEGGVIATQAWDYKEMTFIPDLNFLEFIPEEEHIKWQMDHSYKPKTLLLDELEEDRIYEIVLTNFHGGALIRYRIGDMIRITSMENRNLDIKLPQMTFERRTDDALDFVIVKLTEKKIWQAIESAGLLYEDWVAYKKPGESVLHLLVEPKADYLRNLSGIQTVIQELLVRMGKNNYETSGVSEDWRNDLNFNVDLTLLPRGTFADYTAQKQHEGADPAHLKPTHINPSDKELSILLSNTKNIITISEDNIKKVTETEGEESSRITV